MSYKNIGKPIVLTSEETKHFNEILNPPKKPMLTLEIYREIVQNEYRALEQQFTQIEQELETLKKHETVKKYLELLEKYRQLKINLSSLEHVHDEKINQKIKEYDCPHPLYAVRKSSVVCLVCQRKQEFYYNPLTSEWLENLINEKKLIAEVTSYLNEREWNTPIYIPKEIEPFQNIVDFYSVLYDNKEELESYGIVNENHSLEDLVWEHYLQKKKTKTKK